MDQITEIKEEKKHKLNPNSLKNLRPYKKGERRAGQGKGAKKGSINYSTLRTLAIEKLARENKKDSKEIDIEIMANALLEARKGHYKFYKDDKDRVFGTAVQNTDITSKGDKISIDPRLVELAKEYEEKLKEQI